MSTKTLYVGNLPYSLTEAQLASHFSDFGGSNARIIEGRGFGFIDIDPSQLDAAITATDNVALGGRELKVSEARPKASVGSGGRSRY